MPMNEAMKAAMDLVPSDMREEAAEHIDSTTNLPALLAVAEAARELDAAWEKWEADPMSVRTGEVSRTRRALRAALAKLPPRPGPIKTGAWKPDAAGKDKPISPTCP